MADAEEKGWTEIRETSEAVLVTHVVRAGEGRKEAHFTCYLGAGKEGEVETQVRPISERDSRATKLLALQEAQQSKERRTVC